MSYVPPEDIEKAKKIDLITYLQCVAPHELVKASRNEYTTRTHDSLRMSNGFWNWFSMGIGGKNAVDFLEKIKHIKFPKSAEMVLKSVGDNITIRTENYSKKEDKKLILPPKNTNENIVKQYLKQRGIDKEIIQKCIDKHLIYEEKFYHNVVFLGYDEMGNIKYAGCRATNESDFKNEPSGSDKTYSFKLESSKKTDTIYVFESAIDALSYATLLKLNGLEWKDKTIISLAGVYKPATNISDSKIPVAIQHYLEKHKEIKKIYLCLDNDKAGRDTTKALQIVLPKQYEIIDKPCKKEKDYNEFLCHILGIKRIKNDKKISMERTR